MWHEVNGAREPVVLNLLAETVRKASETAHLHTHREILPLRVAGADRGHVRVAHDRFALGASDNAGAVTPFTVSGNDADTLRSWAKTALEQAQIKEGE